MDNISQTHAGLRELALFAGAGGGILGGHLLGWRTVCGVEWNAYAASVLVARQNDGVLPPFPIWDDVQTFDGKPWRGLVDVVSGGFPCTNISCAGRGEGITGPESGMWAHMARIVGEVRPRYVLVENSPMLTSRGLGRVLGDLAALGYDAEWGVLGACDVGAPHKRERIWILASNANIPRLEGEEKRKGERIRTGLERCGYDELANSTSIGLEKAGAKCTQGRTCGCSENLPNALRQRQPRSRPHWYAFDPAEGGDREADETWAKCFGGIWGIESPVGRVANGVAARMDRLKAIGNGQVSSVAALAFRTLAARITPKT